MDKFNKPNIVLPMAASYNTRQDNAADKVAAGVDQRKVNSYYEVAANALTGNKSLYLVSRPAAHTVLESNVIGTADSVELIIEKIGATKLDRPWIFYLDGTQGKVGSATSNTNIITNCGAPLWIDATTLSGVDYAVVQGVGVGGINSRLTAHFASAINAWTEISASAYTAIAGGSSGSGLRGKIEHLDGYAFQLGADNKIYNSTLNTLATWSSTNFIPKSIYQDDPQGLAKLGGIILAFGSETVEAFRNAGNALGSPLARVPELAFRVGCYVPQTTYYRHYSVELNGKLYFLGANNDSISNSSGYQQSLWTFDGREFHKISPVFIDKIMANNSVTCIGVFPFQQQSAIYIALSASNVGPNWLMYFPEHNEWFEWNSQIFQPVNGGYTFIGGAGAGRIKRMYAFNSVGNGNANAFRDGSVGEATAGVYSFIHQFKLPKNSHAKEAMAWAGVMADTMSASSSAGDKNLYVAFSNNDYVTFNNPRAIDMTQSRKQIYRCGAYDELAVQLSYSGNQQIRIQQFIAKTM